ncbi:hypothetical protein VitviT2T_019823 [Vitis vinifera]|uniref:Uncharacterized protein n=1 Tax=Vitis vinifera TaxID=29760 RepID=A0ABY9D485_VITVI|nr:hypothetical protein VitviT2T_019823 [Vitis vinifera]
MQGNRFYKTLPEWEPVKENREAPPPSENSQPSTINLSKERATLKIYDHPLIFFKKRRRYPRSDDKSDRWF